MLKQLADDGPLFGAEVVPVVPIEEIKGQTRSDRSLNEHRALLEKRIKLSPKPTSQRCIWRSQEGFLMREGKQHELA